MAAFKLTWFRQKLESPSYGFQRTEKVLVEGKNLLLNIFNQVLRGHDQSHPGSQGWSDDGSWSHDDWSPVHLVITNSLSIGLKKLF